MNRKLLSMKRFEIGLLLRVKLFLSRPPLEVEGPGEKPFENQAVSLHCNELE